MITSEQIIIRFKKLWSSILYWKEKVDLHLLTAIHFKQTRQPLQVIYRDRNESWLHDRIQMQTFQRAQQDEIQFCFWSHLYDTKMKIFKNQMKT
jgi:hypothetical protein